MLLDNALKFNVTYLYIVQIAKNFSTEFQGRNKCFTVYDRFRKIVFFLFA